MNTTFKNNIVSPTHPENFAGLKCHVTTIICREKTIILGDVTIGSDCVVHPTAVIIANKGPIIIGNNNLIEERVEIINNNSEPMSIGNNNRFEVDCRCQAKKIGNNNWLEPKSGVSSDTELTEFCIIGPGCNMIETSREKFMIKASLDEHPSSTSTSEELVGDNNIDIYKPYTLISGHGCQRRIIPYLAPSYHNSQLDFLRKILPNYNKLLPRHTTHTPAK